ncbi:MAG: M67 family metallopeptidase [Thioploca sp.]|nr:M67 family metallopeptidase [Thioploca sp.]
MILKLPRCLVNQLFRHAQTAPMAEICGLIGKNQANQFSCYAIPNIATQPTHRFEMSPQQQIAALRTMREQHQGLFAIYHSHPHSEALPSWLDTQLAYYPEAFYLIISLYSEGVLQLRGFQLQQAIFKEVDLVIELLQPLAAN